MKNIRKVITYKMIAMFLLLAGVTMVAESCSKHACGTRHQKKMKNKRIKAKTNFMTY